MAGKSDRMNTKWWVPVSHTTPKEGGNFEGETEVKAWMKPTEKYKIIDSMPPAETALIVNVRETGT